MDWVGYPNLHNMYDIFCMSRGLASNLVGEPVEDTLFFLIYCQFVKNLTVGNGDGLLSDWRFNEGKAVESS